MKTFVKVVCSSIGLKDVTACLQHGWVFGLCQGCKYEVSEFRGSYFFMTCLKFLSVSCFIPGPGSCESLRSCSISVPKNAKKWSSSYFNENRQLLQSDYHGEALTQSHFCNEQLFIYDMKP